MTGPDRLWARLIDPMAYSGGPVLVCLPHAGAGVLAYAQWRARQVGADVVAIQLPSRDDRIDEPMPANVSELVAQIVSALGPLASCPLALFGHSYGAVLAYEVARTLTKAGTPPRLLAVSGNRSVTTMCGRRTPHDASMLADRLAADSGERMAELLADPEWRRMLLTPLSEDLRLYDGYVHAPGPRLPVPVIAFAGLDDPATTPQDVSHWADVSTEPLRQRWCEGGHFFIRECRDQVQADILAALREPGRRDLGAVTP